MAINKLSLQVRSLIPFCILVKLSLTQNLFFMLDLFFKKKRLIMAINKLSLQVRSLIPFCISNYLKYIICGTFIIKLDYLVKP